MNDMRPYDGKIWIAYWTAALSLDTAAPGVSVAVGILADITSRRGLRQAFDDIDLDIQREIVMAWADIVRSDAAAAAPQKGQAGRRGRGAGQAGGGAG